MPAENLSLTEGALFALGNPLLDISAEVTPEFLKKYGLKSNDAILAGDEHVPLFKEMISQFNVQYIPGGAGLNTTRYCQWLLNDKCRKASSYVGCVGKDDYANKLRDLCERDGVNVQFFETDKAPTGTCGVCITGQDRSLVANLAAANLYDKSVHLESKPIWQLVEKAQIYYSAGFPLTVTPEGLLTIAQHAADKNKIFTTNLSAEFLCEFFKDPMMKLNPYTDYLFGNEAEARKFSQVNGGPASGDVKEIAKWASLLPKVNKKRDRYVVFTQGTDETVVACKGEIILSCSVALLAKDQIIDTNGAGDAFVGGFIAGLIKGLDLKDCVLLGNSAAKYCIQMPGSVFNLDDASRVSV